MKNNLFKKISFEKLSFFILIIAVFLIMIFVFFLFFTGKKSLELTAPNKGEVWEAGKTYSILWQSSNISRLGIVLFRDDEPEWIAKNIDAGLKRYDWTIDFGQQYGEHWIAIFEYPWHEKALIDYSTKPLTISPSYYYLCDKGSIERDWLHVPGDMPESRKVFITRNRYTGNLGGLEGADQVCQQEANSLELEGEWLAFLGGDKRGETILERLEDTPKGLDGFFIEAVPSFELERGEGCHRFIASNLTNFLATFSGDKRVYSRLLSSSFFARVDSLWLGRVSRESKEECIFLPDTSSYIRTTERYSFGTTCRNWTTDKSYVEGYQEEDREFPQCYTPEGDRLNALRQGGLSSASSNEGFIMQQGKTCDTRQYLVCIEAY